MRDLAALLDELTAKNTPSAPGVCQRGDRRVFTGSGGCPAYHSGPAKWRCSREAGHSSQHIATIGHVVMAAWRGNTIA